MVTQNKFEDFKASMVPLEGSNLIEASAGTGKTYSIAILVLRLILEKRFSIKEILMVTFTKAAVAELEERIRLFIRSAYHVSNNEVIDDEMISALVNNSIKINGREEVSSLLRNAVIYLDETAVLTIHSFCQQTLNEFAFETNQLFGAELLHDTSDIIESEVNKFWRKHITLVPIELLNLFGEGLSRKDIKQIVKDHLDGMRYYEYDATEKYVLSPVFYANIIAEINSQSDSFNIIKNELIQQIGNENGYLKKQCQENTTARKNLLPHVDNPEEFLKYLDTHRSGYVRTLFNDILLKIDACNDLEKEIKISIKKSVNPIYYAAIAEVETGVKKSKLQNNQVSFDDLIANLHRALVKKDNPKLVTALQTKYKAVFIDEFQDTDRLQYEIFKQAFGTATVLFYIGDPKQSIYAWRKADIATYFNAYDDVANKYGMNENYRSSVSFIQAMNTFFLPVAGFDTFHFPEDEQSIQYIEVKSPDVNTKGQLQLNSAPVVPISINPQPNTEAIELAVAAQVINLLSNKNYTIAKNNDTRSIRPSDIGILVRKNKEGHAIKAVLAKYGIPAVTIGDAKVLESEEAIATLYILEAMIDITRSNINRALLCSFTGYAVQHILSLDDETVIELFKKYKANWDEDGIYTAVVAFIVDFGVHQILLQFNSENGERIITNLYQLIELLYKIQSTKKLSPIELIDWLKRGIERNDAAGDEYEQRIENDEECVKIVTIHKSKGLEYNIVLAPFLDFAEWKEEPFCNYRNENHEYINLQKKQASEEQLKLYRQQSEQENRRLIYVAITRAVYKCFIYKNMANYYNQSTLSFFTDALQNADPIFIKKEQALNIPSGYYYNKSLPTKQKVVDEPVQFNLLQKNWSRMSYTMLSADMEKRPKTFSGARQDEYDHFIFSQLVKGNKTGNMLHYIFENIHFTNNERWQTVIDTAIKRFTPAYKASYESKLVEVLSHVLNADIRVGDTAFHLAKIGNDQRIHEFEFDFPVDVFQPAILQTLSNEKISINVKDRYELEGIMNGKIDMLFEYQGKYFVLDWKSTFLGDSLENYKESSLEEAMNENNYHLQYLIYTLATKKYLESRLPDFDYEKDFGGVLYLFVRGMRKGTNSGIFNCKPTLEQIDALDRLLSKTVLNCSN